LKNNAELSILGTPEPEYFEHLERFLGLVELIIDDLKGKGFIKCHKLPLCKRFFPSNYLDGLELNRTLTLSEKRISNLYFAIKLVGFFNRALATIQKTTVFFKNNETGL